ncbi:hypothetical protein TGMAS_221860 [Toxoplasma gondii MAS]|uniref:Uncharacterized protein n=4 Tax=Toxoplasma gondii TaxID=5811 RepID=A0A086QPJ7_TOXGO|nr:hypothetical protein TGRH88_000850 [Toxoplasma gondii]KFG47534.1 hypothetical protein TGFOU_221860 [Toxoplasma gondii FOU]KFH14529.1 hypothetical protein TGMAS_221860 [Toxoplasma gondii MAS]RQX74937.1 hypothetical protein TGCAST_221860 [Toxoplasma gondii CAST]
MSLFLPRDNRLGNRLFSRLLTGVDGGGGTFCSGSAKKSSGVSSISSVISFTYTAPQVLHGSMRGGQGAEEEEEEEEEDEEEAAEPAEKEEEEGQIDSGEG